jgi:Gluconate 2-dehydrogenase subunit 3
MFWKKKKSAKLAPPDAQSHAPQTPALDPLTGNALPPKDTPGYYPGFHTLDQQQFWDAATREVILHRVNNIAPIRFFTPEEAFTMQAVVDRVMPQDDRADKTWIPILPGIDERLFLNRIEGYRYEDMPSDQDAYRLGAKAIEAMAQELSAASFHTLRITERENILQCLHDGEPRAAKELWQAMSVKRFWAMLVSDCCAVYYAHPYVWDEIGFGGPAYPRGYMRLEEGKAEPWEVDEQRYEWLAPADTVSDRPQQGEKQSSHHGQAGTH